MKQSNEQKKKLLKPYSCPYFRMIDLAGTLYCGDNKPVMALSIVPGDGDIDENYAPGARGTWDDDGPFEGTEISRSTPF